MITRSIGSTICCPGTGRRWRHPRRQPPDQPQAKAVATGRLRWFQLGVANANSGRSAEAIAAYERAITLDPDYDLAMFNLGGVHWNDRDLVAATRVWRRAIEKFPDHALAAEVREMLPLFMP